ncbi:ThuA domain-containing protein [Flavobacterium sp. ASW18X]|uniref:ThuA domain-containing protein n=1 Tax=Flavobacterium sp. ASW18X TaxID=2572595 RepID=UPI0010AEDEBE|nr:ThuA domain-containing protein [Flavobacterium sp. ASW18X]TKD64997.1 ThuA domain-containing protein [Flavobacterium sp. ASW18X]
MSKLVTLLLAVVFMGQHLTAQYSNPKFKEARIPELVLTFTKTAGFRHKSIEKGVKTLREIGRENGFIVLQTETSADFNLENLKNYKCVVFLNTTMDVLNDQEQKAFERYIQGGGSFMGIHAAADTEYNWPWYGKLVGAYFAGHPNNPNVRTARINVVDKMHACTAHLPSVWERTDEWYNYKNINPDINVLMKLDETSYEGGTNGDNHPIAWYHEFDGGRAFYTGSGHTDATFDEPHFRKHLLEALLWCMDRQEEN